MIKVLRDEAKSQSRCISDGCDRDQDVYDAIHDSLATMLINIADAYETQLRKDEKITHKLFTSYIKKTVKDIQPRKFKGDLPPGDPPNGEIKIPKYIRG